MRLGAFTLLARQHERLDGLEDGGHDLVHELGREPRQAGASDRGPAGRRA
jgi:hypothetical protein